MRGWGPAVALVLLVACAPGTPDTRTTGTEKQAALEVMIAEVRERYPTVDGVSAEQVQALLQTENPVLVDVRPEAERLISRIPGAIPAEEFEANLGSFADRPVVAYCTVGERSARFAERMAQGGVEVLNFEGSLLAWTHAAGPLVDANGPTSRLHVYGPTWDLAAEGYQTTW